MGYDSKCFLQKGANRRSFQSYIFFDLDSCLIAIEHSVDDFYQHCFCLYIYIYLHYYNSSNYIYNIHCV